MKICVVYASAGAGHKRAAEALYLRLQKTTQYETTIVDVLDYTKPFFKKTYPKGYTFMVASVPFVWKFFFWLLDIRILQKAIKIARRLQNSLCAKKFENFLINEKFDYIVSTHFLPNEVVSSLKQANRIQSQLISCVTDFDVHKIWLADHVDLYCVASDWTKEKLKWLGVNLEKIVPTGIPTMKEFAQLPEIGPLKEKLGLAKDTFTVLVATGSFGFGPIEEIIDKLKDFQVIVVSGHNKSLYERLQTKKYSNALILGHVDNMHELMAVSDVMVTKPGGLSISEALVSQLPLIFFRAIPGQEMNNIKVLNSFGIGTANCDIPEIVTACNQFKTSSDTYMTALKKTKMLARPDAADQIIQLLT